MACPNNPPQATIETTFGALVSGIWIQQLFLGFILAQMVDYYRYHFKTDSTFNKTIVTLLLVLNLFVGGTDFHVFYRSAVLFYGDFEHFDLQEWTMWTEPGWTAIIGFLAQLFFLARCQRIVKSNILTGVLTLLVLFSFGAGLAVSGSFIKDKRFSSLGQFKTPIILWLVSTASADVAIAAALTTHLLRSRTMFRKTNAVITRLITTSMETSAMTAIVATLNLVLFLPLQDTAYHLLPQFSVSRIYTLTVMVTLLARTENRVLMNSGHTTMPTTLKFRPTNSASRNLSVGITTTVENDRDNRDNIEIGLETMVDPRDSKRRSDEQV